MLTAFPQISTTAKSRTIVSPSRSTPTLSGATTNSGATGPALHPVVGAKLRTGSAPVVQRKPRREERREARRKRREEAKRRRQERKQVTFEDPQPIAISATSGIRLTAPTYIPMNPIGRILRNEPTGLTTPTINGVQLPDHYVNAGQLMLNAVTPKTTAYDASTKQCRFAEVNATLSANVIVPTEPDGRRWRMNMPGPEIKGLSVCHARRSVPVTMTGDPDSKTILERVKQNEQEHVDDLGKAYRDHLKPYETALKAERATGEDAAECQENLMTALGKKDMLAVKGFIDAWLASISTRDSEGGHTLKNAINAKSDCSSIEITSRP